MKFLKASITLIFISISIFAEITPLEKKLYELPDVIFEKISTPDNYQAAYKLMVKQPLDHKNPEKGYFYQKVYLSHSDYSKPTVLITNGYNADRNWISELATLLKANQVSVEHRYFGESMPDSVDYSYLNLEQVTADLHRINELMRELYTGKWISSGISKGGQTTIFYRYFYPNDVDVSIPYVAPLNLSLEDERIYLFLDTVGTKECRDKITDFQKLILKNRKKILPKLNYYAKGAGLTFNYLSLEQAFEYAVLEYSFSFWQWGASCTSIPHVTADIDTQLDHLLDVSGVDFFADQSMMAYASHYFQAADEMGYYGYETEDFKGLLKALPMKPHPLAAFTPNKMEVDYDGSIPTKVSEWLKTEGNNFLYIYGGSDTWSATAVLPSDETNSEWFFLAGKDHGQARIANMSPNELRLFVSKLEEWLDIRIK
jgi:hypothetical protein